jgi:hypothetical protein
MTWVSEFCDFYGLISAQRISTLDIFSDYLSGSRSEELYGSRYFLVLFCFFVMYYNLIEVCVSHSFLKII